MTIGRGVFQGAFAVLLTTGVGVIGLGMVRGSSSFSDYFELAQSHGVLRQTVDGLKKENDELASEIERIRTSPSYAKKVLRDKYHVTEEGEDIIFFAD